MAFLTPLNLDAARGLGRDVGIDVAEVAALDAGSVNSNFIVRDTAGQRFFLRVYEEQGEEGARRERELLRALAAAGVPTAVPLSSARELSHSGKPIAIYPWIEGSIVCQSAVTPAHCEAVGEALARVHMASDRVTLVEGRFHTADLEVRLASVSSEYREDAASIRARLAELTAKRAVDLPTGLVHGDLFRDNVLWDATRMRITGLIDFESASKGTLVYDLAVTILAWCYGDRFDDALVRALFEGYARVRPLDRREVAEFNVEASFAALRFATTRITDYAMRAPPGQPPKRDYRRFLARLDAIERGELSRVLAELA